MIKIVLQFIPSQEYFKEIINIVKNDVKTKNLIYVTLGRPYKYVMSLFDEEKVRMEKLLVIDCVSKCITPLEEDPEKGIFLESPENITELCIALDQAMKALPGEETTTLFDSLSTLLLYHDENVVGKFANYIINCMRLHNIRSVFIVLEADVDKRIVKVIESLVDEVVR